MITSPCACVPWSDARWARLPHPTVVNNRAVILTLNHSVVLLHLDWAPRLTQGAEGPSNGKTGAWQCKSVRALFERWIPKCWGFKGETPTQRNCLTSLNLLVNLRCSMSSNRTKRGTAIYCLLPSYRSLKLMQECEVCATHVTSNMHPAAACRDSC